MTNFTDFTNSREALLLVLLGVTLQLHKAKVIVYRSCSEPSLLKLSQNKKDLNDITAALFLLSFSQLPAAKNTLKTGQL